MKQKGKKELEIRELRHFFSATQQLFSCQPNCHRFTLLFQFAFWWEHLNSITVSSFIKKWNKGRRLWLISGCRSAKQQQQPKMLFFLLLRALFSFFSFYFYKLRYHLPSITTRFHIRNGKHKHTTNMKYQTVLRDVTTTRHLHGHGVHTHTHKADDVMTWRVCFVAPAWLDSRSQSRWLPIVMTTRTNSIVNTQRPLFMSSHLIRIQKQTRNGWVDKTAPTASLVYISQIYWLYESMSILLPKISSGSLDEPERE
jgi:hypothetical protein